MSGESRRRPSAALIVSIVALVVALSGTAVAGPVANFAKKLVNGSSIKKHSIPANRLANHSITSQQINKSKLGTVPHSALADTAATAAKLGNATASSFLPASKLIRWNFSMNKGAAAHSFAVGPLTAIATCSANGTNTDARLAVKTSEAGTFVSISPDSLPGSTTTLSPTDPPYTIVEQDSAIANDGNSGELVAFDPRGTLAVFSTAQTFGVAINTPGAHCRFFGYLINDA